MGINVELKMFVEMFFTKGSSESRTYEEEGPHDKLLKQILPSGVYAYRFFRAYQTEIPKVGILVSAPFREELSLKTYYCNCTLIEESGLDGKTFFVRNEAGNRYPFRDGDILIFVRRGSNGFINKVLCREGQEIKEKNSSQSQ